MTPYEIRTELLGQHRQIRDLMAATRQVALRARSGDGGVHELLESVGRLADCVRIHNLREEELLRDVIPSIDAWGSVRAAAMTDEHIKEHTRLSTALAALPTASAETAGIGVIALIALMRDHMEREEATFLREEVLREEVVIPDNSTG